MTEPLYPLLAVSRLRMGTDGIGVTTLVSGAGCPLSCRWCINKRLLREAPAESVTPEELLEPVPLVCMWEADFQRRAVLLRFDDGSAAELALDLGALYGPTHSLPLCELELELKEGEPAAALTLLAALRERFSLKPQEKSKFARARALD